jgi:spermidine synthase
MESNHLLSSTTDFATVKQHDWRLKVVVFICGAVLMGLEMAGSRVLAIHFGSSIYVWGAIISVFLAALAGGYYSGGIIADRRPTFLLLNILVLIGGCWLLIIPLYANWVCRGVRHVNPGERLNPLIATVLLFGGPSVLLGMVSPFAVRLAARNLEKIGNLSGRLYALSTVGSIAGTLITAFWLIPLMGVAMLLQALGIVLIILTLVVIPKSRKLIVVSMPLAVFVVSLLLLPSFRPRSTIQNEKIVFECDSAYHHIQVIDNPVSNYRFLHFNSYTESGISLTAPHETLLAYTDAFQLGRIFRPSLERVLIIGGGGGVGARKFVTDDPKVVVDVVEIDPVVVDLGYRFFYLQNSERLRIHTEDGRGFVRSTTNRYDLVVLDAYTIGGQIPFHLTTQEFMSEIAAVLKPGGVVLANINSALEGVRSRFLHAEYKTLSTVFPELHLFALGGEAQSEHDDVYLHSRRNLILVALTDPRSWTKEQIIEAADRLVAENIVKTRHFTSDARQLLNRPLNTDNVPLLTDDYAPVDTMLF